MKTFKQWLENVNVSGSESIILNYLMDRLNIRDENVVLQMQTTDIDPQVIHDLLNRGIVNTDNDAVVTRIKNGITIRELIDLLAAERT